MKLTLKETIDLMDKIKSQDYNDEIDIVCDKGKFYIQEKIINIIGGYHGI